MVVRAVCEKDLKAIYKLASLAGSGLTTLPLSRERLAQRIQLSQRSFASRLKSPKNEYYFLVLEDFKTQEIVGTTGIFSAVGLTRPFYNATVKSEEHVCSDPKIKSTLNILHVGTPYKGYTELATLFLRKNCRHGGNGSLLSKSRHLLMASHPKRFAKYAMAEIRGWVDHKGRSPFWDTICRPFFQMDLATADSINSMGNWKFIHNLYPNKPIYLELLPIEVRKVVALPHPESVGALKLLEAEGFKYNHVIDIFDGGPCVEAKISEIRAVRDSQTAHIITSSDEITKGRYIVANCKSGQFRAVQSALTIINRDTVGAPKETLRALDLKSGEIVRFVTMSAGSKA